MTDIEKKMHEDEDRAFLKAAAKTRHRIELLARYGFDTSQAIQFLICMNLESIENVLWGGGDSQSVTESLNDIADIFTSCQVTNHYGNSIAVTGTINTL